MDGTQAGFARLDRAVRDGEPDVRDVALVVGASAADHGMALDEVIDLVEHAYDGDPDHPVVRAACVAWADAVLGRVHGAGCEDPLTSLVSVPHLRTRLDDVRRERAAHAGTGEHVLVVVEVAEGPRHGIEDSLGALEVADVLRTVLPGEEVLARTATRRFAALVVRERADVPTLGLLRLLLGRTSVGVPAPRLWVEELPEHDDDLTRVLGELTR